MGNQILGSDKNIRLNDFPMTGFFQSFEWSPAFNAEEVYELGRDTKVATALELETTGSFDLLSTGGTPGVLARIIADRNVGTNAFLGYKLNLGGGGGKNGYTFTQSDLRECVFDVVEVERSDQASYDRAIVLPRCYLTSLSGRADANGNATETMNFSGAFVIGAPSPYHVVRSVPATRTGTTTLLLADNTVASSGYALMYVYVDEKRIRQTASGDTITAALGAAGVVTISGGYTIPVTARLHAIVWDNTSPTTTYPAVIDSDRPTTNFHVKGWQADIYVAPADPTNPTANEKWLKVQSIDWNIDMRTEKLRQISYNPDGTAIYCILPTYPLDITANVSVYEGDWADWKAILDLTVKTFPGTGSAPYQDTFDFAPASMKNQFAIVVQYRTKAGTLVQTWRFTDMRVDGYSNRVQVQGRSEVTWTMKGTAFTLVGANA